MNKPLFAACIAILLLSLAGLASGCSMLVSTPETNAAGETLTPTPNATLKAIAQMLTQTSAAPTITLTRVVTVTVTPTPTATTPPEGSSDRPVAVGQRVEQAGESLTVLSTSSVNAAGSLKADKNTALLDVEVIIQNRSSGDLDYTPLYFHLVDQGGAEYQPESSAVPPALQSGTLKPGEWVRGHILFSLATGKTAQRLSYAPQLPSGQPVTLWVDLGRPTVKAELPENGPIATTQPLPGAGQRVESDGIALTVQQVSASSRVAQTKAGKGNVMLVLNITAENVSRTKIPVNPQYFTLKDPQGYEYPAVIIPAEGLLQAGSLGELQKVSGQVVFEIPTNVKELVLEYQPQVLTETYPQIRVQINVPTVK